MDMKKILIIEDDHFSANRLERLIQDIDNTTEIHGPLNSVVEVVNELSANNDYDLIFSDIRLVDGDVFEAFRIVKPLSFVVFTTAYDDYAMEAIKNNGIDYLMKPIDANELRNAINKLDMLVQHENCTSHLDGILSDMHLYKERFLVNKGDELIMLSADDITYIYKSTRQILAFTEDGASYPLSMNMQELEETLNPIKFFRLNRQYIISIHGIKKINLFFNSKLIIHLKGGIDDIVISKDKAAQLKKWLDR